jgi:murein DD-endopeptidase MepM/ murein hydrolase activator NlpD
MLAIFSGLALVDTPPASAVKMCRPLWMPPVQLTAIGHGFGPVPDGGFHNGIDLVAPLGSPVRTAGAGVVTFAGPNGDYGNMVEIRHPEGFVTRYGHLATIRPEIRPGFRINTLELIGAVGQTGNASGPHVHFEVRINGQAIDPSPYLSLSACPGARPLEVAKAPPRATHAASK